MLRDWDKFILKADSFLPDDYAETIKNIAKEIEIILSGFFRGQLNVCLLLGCFYAVGLSIVGLNSGILIGLTAGLLTFIPYVGAFVGMLIGIFMGYLQFDADWSAIGKVAGVFLLGQFLEGNFVSPKLIGDKVKLHPVWMLFGMLAGASLMGPIGVVLAVPLTAIIGVFVRHVIEHYQSDFI
jgi:predicted PurR-regulated permease PerM